MKKITLVLIGVVFLFITSVYEVKCQIEESEKESKLSEVSRAKFDEIKLNIKSELNEYKNHRWAGEYYFGDGLGVNVSISLAPKSGFVFTWVGCLGLYDLNYGKVEEKDGKIIFLPELPNKREGFQGVDTEFYPVLWGERHYLIPMKRMIDFTNDVNSGFISPRSSYKMFSGLFPLRESDREKPASGKPNIPAEFMGYLLDKPIKARISEVLESSLVDDEDYDSKTRTTVVILDVGSKNGVKVGMEFRTFKPSRIFEAAEIIEVGETNSKARIVQTVFKDVESLVPTIDWRFSTRTFK
jgi:hypothetical protein